VRLTGLTARGGGNVIIVILQQMPYQARAVCQFRMVVQHGHGPALQTASQQQAEDLPPQSVAECGHRIHS